MAPPRAPRSPAGAIAQLRGSACGWAVWDLRPAASGYMAAVVTLAGAAAAVTAATSAGSGASLGTYLALLGCGVITAEWARPGKQVRGATGRDFQTVWYLAAAVVFSPVFAILAPILLGAYQLIRVRGGFIYRRVFGSAALGLAYGAASATFHAAPAAITGGGPGGGLHAVVWAALAAGCGVQAWAVNCGLLAGAIRLASPHARLRDAFGRWPGLVWDLIELSAGVQVALVVAIDPVLMVLAVPLVVLYRRALMNAQVVARIRLDAVTGVLTGAAWLADTDVEVFSARRAGTPLAVALVGVDHFSSISQSAGPAAAGEVLRAVAGIVAQSVPAGRPGRVGSSEFAAILPEIAQGQAHRIAERIRGHVAAEPVTIAKGSHAGYAFPVTVSVGLAYLGDGRRTGPDLVDAARGALAAARGGQDGICVASR